MRGVWALGRTRLVGVGGGASLEGGREGRKAAAEGAMVERSSEERRHVFFNTGNGNIRQDRQQRDSLQQHRSASGLQVITTGNLLYPVRGSYLCVVAALLIVIRH
jgi:hypothetical protein